MTRLLPDADVIDWLLLATFAIVLLVCSVEFAANVVRALRGN